MCRRAEHASLRSLCWQARLCSTSHQLLQPASQILKPGNILTAEQICEPSHYYLPPDDITDQVNKAIGAENHVYLKGGAEAGKSSWGYLMSLAFPGDVWYISGASWYCDEGVERELQMPTDDFCDAADQHGKVVIFDEAHRLWDMRHSQLYNFFVKNLSRRYCTVIFLSTTSYFPLINASCSPEVTNQRVLQWAMDAKTSMAYVRGYRSKAGLSEPSPAACQALHRFFSGHRGFMASALKLICDKKIACRTPQEMHLAIARLSSEVDDNSPFRSRMNGERPPATSIIDCVAGLGYATADDIQRALRMSSHEVELGVATAVTIGGIVTAKPTARPRADTEYEIPNPFLLANRRLEAPIQVPQPKTAFDVLRTALAFFDYRQFVSDARNHPVREDGVPHAHNFNAAMHGALERAGLKSESIRSAARDSNGKPDLQLEGFCIESMVHSTRSQFVAHHKRFKEKELYNTSKPDNALLVVFVPRDNLRSARSIATDLVKSQTKTPIALVEIGDSLWRWRVELIRNSKARKVVNIKSNCAVPRQRYCPVHDGVYVRVKIGRKSTTMDVLATLTNSGFPFTVDGLIKAVSKLVWLNQRQLLTAEVLPPSRKPGKKPYTRVSTPLVGASEDEPYHVRFP